MSSIDTKKIPGEMNDRVKLCTYLSPGDLLVLWNSFKTACTLLSPEASQCTVRNTKNLCGFWKTFLDTATAAAESGEYPLMCTITFCRGDFFLVVRVLDRLLDRLFNGPDIDWFTESAKKPIAELRRFFKDRLYDPFRAGHRHSVSSAGSVVNDLHVGKETRQKALGIFSPKPRRIILFGTTDARPVWLVSRACDRRNQHLREDMERGWD